MHFTSLFRLVPLLAALVVVGCSTETDNLAAVSVAKRKKGGRVRLINLTGSKASLTIVKGPFFSVEPERGSAFSLYGPGKHKALVKVGGAKDIEVELNVVSDKTITVYVMERGKPEVVMMDGDTATASGQPSVRLVNVSGSAATIQGIGDKESTLKSGEAAPIAEVPGGDKTLTVSSGGKTARTTENLELGFAYTLVVYERGGELKVLNVVNNPGMEMGKEGSSAAG